MVQDVFIIGASGNVGSSLVRQVIERRDSDAKLHSNPTRLVGLASSENCVYSSGGIGAKEALSFAARKSVGKPATLDEILEMVGNAGQESLVFVDTTALRDEMVRFHADVMRKTSYGIVTSNKNPLAYSDYETFEFLAREVSRYGFRCSVMAGAEAVNLMLDLRDLNDRLVRFEGCFSGTLNFITTALQDGGSLSKSVGDASALGYTEPNPADDLSGEDVAKKMLILARSAGFDACMRDVSLVPFVTAEVLGSKTGEGLFAALGRVDGDFSRRALRAKGNGNVLRYVATAENAGGNLSMRVGLGEVPEKSPLGALRGTGNKIVVVTGTYPEGAPYVVEAPGAGPEVTAQNIRRDLLYQVKGRVVRQQGFLSAP